MSNYKYFANPITDKSLPVITSNEKNSVEAISFILKSRGQLNDYEITSKPSSNIIQVCNGHKELRINWLNLENNKIEEDVYIVRRNTRIRYFLPIITKFIGVRFDINKFRDCILTKCFEEYHAIFCYEIDSKDDFLYDAVVLNINELFNKNNHCLASVKITNISQNLNCLYQHYEA